MFKKSLILSIFFFVFIFVLSGWCNEPIHLVILHINDTHGKLLSYDTESSKDIGGIARIATKIKEIKAENKNTLVFHVGDDFSRGDMITSCFGGEANMLAMESAGYDAYTPGNGDFYFGINNLIKQTSLVKFPTLMANIVYKKDDKLIFQPYVIKEIGGVRVAILGLGYIHEEHPSSKLLKLLDPVTVAKKYISILRDKSDVIIALTHIGLPADVLLAGRVPEIDVIVGGHTHNLLEKAFMIPRLKDKGSVVIIQAGEYGQHLGRLDIDIEADKSGKYSVVKADETLIPINNKIKDDEEVTQILKPYQDKLSEVLFTSKVAITKKEMGNLTAEAVRSQTGSDIAMLDVESIQNGIKEGDVTLAKIYAIHPWRNRVLMFELTGEQIQRALSEKDAIASGFGYTKSNGKVDNLNIEKSHIEPTKTYKVAMDEFLWAYIPSLSNVSFSDTGERVDTILIKYFGNMKNSL